MKRFLPFGAILMVLASCSTGVLPTSSTEKYNEDLASLRPHYPSKTDTNVIEETSVITEDFRDVKPTYDVTETLNMALDSIDVLSKNVRYINGFTIQVYSGTVKKRAYNARGMVKQLLPDSPPVMQFEEPNFTVKVGKYYSTLEAQSDFNKLLRGFRSATIIPARLYIR